MSSTPYPPDPPFILATIHDRRRADAAAFRQAAKQATWKVVGPKRGFLVQGEDRVGAIADLLERLGAAKINVTAIDAVCADGRYGAIFWVAAKDVKKTADLLGAR